MRQRCSIWVLCLVCPMVDSCHPQGLVAILCHISPHDDCVVRVVLCSGGGVHIWGAPFICIHSWRCGRLYWRSGHYNPMQGIFLRFFFLPSQLWSRSSVLGSWGDVGRVASRHIWFRNHLILRQIGWGGIYGSRDQVLCLPRSIPHSRDLGAADHWRVCLTAVSHSNLLESQNKSIHSGLIV